MATPPSGRVDLRQCCQLARYVAEDFVEQFFFFFTVQYFLARKTLCQGRYKIWRVLAGKNLACASLLTIGNTVHTLLLPAEPSESGGGGRSRSKSPRRYSGDIQEIAY